jgi:hypothetical protein
MGYKEELKKALQGIDESRFAKYTDNQLAGFEKLHNVPRTNEWKNKIGDSNKGKIVSEKTKAKLSQVKKGIPSSEETKERLRILAKETKQYLIASEAAKNRPIEKRQESNRKSALSRTGRKADDSHKNNISNALKGKPKSESHRKKLSEAKLGKKMAEEQKEKYKLLFKGERNPMFGKKQSAESRKKMGQNHTGYHIERCCPFCKRTIKGTNFFKYHGDNCKLK